MTTTLAPVLASKASKSAALGSMVAGVNIDKMGRQTVLLRDGDHGFYGDGAVDDGCGWGQTCDMTSFAARRGRRCGR